VQIDAAQNVEFTGVKWMNSPEYHLNTRDIDSFWFHDFEIYVDVWGQLNLGKLIGLQDLTVPFPTFPLNTDGIDPAGTNILIERVKITNFDDAVAVKPCNIYNQVATCSENILVRDLEVNWGIGMTIGSVPANEGYNCVRNVTF